MRRHAPVAAAQAARSRPESLASRLELLTNEIWTLTESGESPLTWPPRSHHRNRYENRAPHWVLSGYGLETARHFHAQGWNVIATMRTPREDVLPRSERLRVLALDVTRPASIAAAIEASGPIDVLVNNAGIGLFGAFEATPMAMAREVF